MPSRTVVETFEAVRAHLRARFGLAGLLFASAAPVVTLVLAWWLGGSQGWRQGSAAPLFLDLAALLTITGLAVLTRWVRTTWLDELRVTATMEDAAGLRRGVVYGSLQLSRVLPPGVSAALVRRAELQVAENLAHSCATLAGSLHQRSGRWMRLGSGALILASIPVISAWVASPERSRRAWSGLVAPLSVMAAPRHAPIVVRPGDAEVARGSALSIEVEAPGRAEATLHRRTAGEVPSSDTREIGSGRVSFTVSRVEAPFEYWVTTPDGSTSERHTVTPVDPLFLAGLTFKLTFPAHTARYPEEYRAALPPLEIPVGTRIRIEGRANRPLGLATLARELSGDPSVELDLDGSRFFGDWTPARSGVYRWRVEDTGGGSPEVAPPPLDITLVRDSVPVVSILFPGRDTILPLSMQQPLVVQARDDFGLASLEMVAYRVRSVGDRGPPVSQRMEMSGSRSAMMRPLLDVSGWGLRAGDAVRYRMRVVDNAPVPQTGESREYLLRMPEASALRRQAQEMLEEAAEEVASLAEDAGREAQENRDLERRSRAERQEERSAPEEQLSFEDQEELRRAVEAQEELAARVDSLRQELSQVSESMREAGLPDPDFREEMNELQRLLEEMTTEELRERMEARDFSQMDETESLEALEQLVQDQEELRRRLEESIERFQRAAADQELRAAEEEAGELARREEALADAMEEGDTPELRVEQQVALEEQAEQLFDRMEEARERLGELEETRAGEQAEEALEQTGDARRNMAEAREQARSGERQSAARKAREAVDALRKAEQALAQAREEMAGATEEAARQALQQTAEDALVLARAQSELRGEMRRADAARQAALRADQASLLRGVRNMAENLSAGSRASRQVDREVSAAIGEAMEAISATVAALDSRRGSTPSPASTAEAAVRALNQVAMSAIASAGQAGQDAAAAGDGEIQEMLEAIARRQSELIMQTEDIMPMQLGQEALAKQMQQLAQGQEAVAGELGDLAQEPDAGEQALGDLEQLAEEALALAETLASERLRAETLERQERLFQRLLDAGRSMERDEESEERESEAPGEFERGVVAPVNPEELNALRYQLPPAHILNLLPPGQRRLVVEYFERLNRAPTDSSPGAGR